MSKTKSILLHLMCMACKVVAGKGWRWHWQHIEREFGRGKYAVRH